jgi:type IV pilus assembly protein PilW
LTPVVDGIVQLQAQYGFDADNDGAISTAEWRNGCAAAGQLPAGAGGACIAATAAHWGLILAVRLAVVARSGQPERPDPTTFLCNTTTVATAPSWNNGTAIDVTTDPDWQCYRYRVFETVIPIRNLIWLPTP